MDVLQESLAWARSLEAPMVFLLVLPFLVAVAGGFAEWRGRRARGWRVRRVSKRRDDRAKMDSRPAARSEAKDET